MLQDRSRVARMAGALFCGAALVLVLAGCSGGDDSGAKTATAPGGTGGAGASGGPPMMGGGGPPAGTGSGGGMAYGGGMGGGGAAQVAATAKPKDTAPAPHYRKDPLQPWWDTTPKPPPILTVVSPIRIATTNTAQQEKPAGVEIQEVPNRRVAGILTGNGVYALIDDFGGKPTVAKPGTVLDDGYVVSSINASSVVLKKVVDNRTYTQVVPLTDAGSSVSTFSGPGAGRPGGPGMMGPGRPGGGRPAKGMGGGTMGGIE